MHLPVKPHIGSSLQGFSLIETLIALAIAGILAAIAYPSFQAQLQKSRRSDAMQALWLLQQAQERYRVSHPMYGSSLQELGIGSALTAGGHYRLELTQTANATHYMAIATGIHAQADDAGCTTLSMRVDRGSATLTPAACWAR